MSTEQMDVDGADQQDEVKPLQESSKSAPIVGGSKNSDAPLINAAVKKFFRNLGWKKGIVISYLGRSKKGKKENEETLASFMERSVDRYRVSFGEDFIEEYPLYVVEDLMALAQVEEGAKVALYSYEIDKHFHAEVDQVDDSRTNNIHAVFENGRTEWVDLRRFKFQLVDPYKPTFKLPTVVEGEESVVDNTAGKDGDSIEKDKPKPAIVDEKSIQTEKGDEPISPSEDRASQTEDAPPLNEERGIQTDAEDQTPRKETSSQTQQTTSDQSLQTDRPAEREERAFQTEKAELSSKGIQTDAHAKHTTEKSSGLEKAAKEKGVTEERGSQTDPVQAEAPASAPTEERGFQTDVTELKDNGAKPAQPLNSNKSTKSDVKSMQIEASIQPSSSFHQETQTNPDELTPKADASCQTDKIKEKPTNDEQQSSKSADPQSDETKAAASSSKEPATGEVEESGPIEDGATLSSPARKKVRAEGALLVLKAPELSKIQKNTKIAVFWENDQEYYAATVLAIRRSKQRLSFHLEYEPDHMREWTILDTREYYLLADFKKYEAHLEEMRDDNGALASENIMRIKRQEEQKVIESSEKNRPLLKEPLIRTEMPDDVKKWADVFASRQGTLEALKIGVRVAVWWRGETRFYKGTITDDKKKKGNKTFHVTYDDGDKQWVNFAREVFIILVPPARANKDAADVEQHSEDVQADASPRKRPPPSDHKKEAKKDAKKEAAKTNGAKGARDEAPDGEEAAPPSGAAEKNASDDVPPIYRVAKGSLIEVFGRNNSKDSAVVKDRRQGDLPFLVEFMDGRSKWMDLGQVKFRLIEGARSRGSSRASTAAPAEKTVPRKRKKSSTGDKGDGESGKQRRSSGVKKTKKRKVGTPGDKE